MNERQDILQVRNLTKIYPVRKGESIKAVNDVSFNVKRGEILGLLGPNGAGKTTTIKTICSLIIPDKGQVLIDGIDNQKDRNKALSKISAVLEGNRNIYWRLTVRENLEYFAALKGKNAKKLREDIDYYIDFFDLTHKANETARKLSRGMQQKLAIAVTMISQTDVILLDEPTLGLDVKASYEVRDLLKRICKEEGRTIILTTHDMNVVQDICDRVIIINNGQIIAEDKIENLMRLFQIKSYQFVIEDQLTTEQRELLVQIPYLVIEEKEKHIEIQLSLEDPLYFYKVTEILGKEKTTITSIESKELNFEKVFMNILGRGEKLEKNHTVI